jgi:CDP-glycerol glycerophosphotransferase (TagB/SpsB family)
MEIQAGAIVSGDLGVPAELYVRFDPGHDPARYESLFRRYPFVRYERAEQASSREHIGNLFASSDVVVSIGSTFNVEAALFDTPTLFIGYDGFRKPERIEDSYALVYELDLFKRLTGGGGIRLVRTREETVDCIRGYLADRSKDREGRRLLVRSVTNPDGMAGERIASEVLRTLGL